jgi:hypothetical protein
MKRYFGDRTIDGVQVLVNEAPLDPRYNLKCYSKNGFEWSYEGPEPRQLSFALLVDHLGDPARAEVLEDRFMREVVANFDNTWELGSDDIAAFVSAFGARA